MSYCHQSGNPGISFSNGFGPLPGNLIRSSVSGASCLGSCGSAPPPPPATTPDLTISAVTLSPSTISSTAQAISLALTTSNLGANAGSSITRVYFSSDNSLSTGDENLIDINISSDSFQQPVCYCQYFRAFRHHTWYLLFYRVCRCYRFNY